jgi:hypothetical protein
MLFHAHSRLSFNLKSHSSQELRQQEDNILYFFAELYLKAEALFSFMIKKNPEKFKYILLLLSIFNNKA